MSKGFIVTMFFVILAGGIFYTTIEDYIQENVVQERKLNTEKKQNEKTINELKIEKRIEEANKKKIVGIKVRAWYKTGYENSGYSKSDTYRFAVKVDGNYYNVSRNTAGGVNNIISEGITGAIAGTEFIGTGYTREIPFGPIVSARNKSNGRQRTIIEEKEGYEVSISPTKEGDIMEYDIDWLRN